MSMSQCHSSSDDNTRKVVERLFNPMTLLQMKQKYASIDWPMLLSEATQLSPNVTKRLLNDSNYQYVVMEPEMLKLLSDALGESSSFVSPRTLVNYIYSQLLFAYSSFLPIPMAFQESNNNLTILELVGSSTRRPRPRPLPIWRGTPTYRQQQYDDTQMAQLSCAAESVHAMMYANGRLFIDKVYPTQKSREELRENVGKMISGVLVGFRSMIDQLSWMTPASKVGAYKKIDNLVKNIGYPDWITDDQKLIEYYEGLGIQIGKDDYFAILQKVMTWRIVEGWNLLFNRTADRADFPAPLGDVNAWYQVAYEPQSNSITIPASILQAPFYDPTLPTAVNFGALGLIVGHELTHGFDDFGVQWDGIGALNGWMDDSSEVGFRRMADCVVEEYGKFCPLNKTEHGDAACVDAL
ncbi:peptidase family M13 [Ancylostoma duodenale]|uniref:Peptidase family M13 n=1 Tax=Ancylostoma duodenale TaxID=51022 RepID=A0A0C2DIU5_9BILA|nr:peptidase family M13 [Ancylostoma duodenale]